MSPADIALWLGRLASVVEAIVDLWKAVEANDDDATEDAQLGVIRAVKNAQARERIGA